MQPGLSSISLLSAADWVPVTVTVTSTVRGRPLQNRYVAQSTGGLRIVMSQALTGAALKVGSIDTLLGDIRNIKFVQRV